MHINIFIEEPLSLFLKLFDNVNCIYFILCSVTLLIEEYLLTYLHNQ